MKIMLDGVFYTEGESLEVVANEDGLDLERLSFEPESQEADKEQKRQRKRRNNKRLRKDLDAIEKRVEALEQG